ncbi:MAG: glycosyltransferase [Opitutales bacterium]
MKEKMPKISVLMPIYNTNEEFLRGAIGSILEQSFGDFEFLILNDSPDNTRLDEIVASFKDPRIKYLKNDKNIGITPSRNKLLALARGEYIAVMDHDDVSLPERFQKQVDFLDNNPDYGVVGTKVKTIGGGIGILRNPNKNENIKLALMRACAIIHPVAMIRKSVLLNNNISYEEAFTPAEDYSLFCRLSSCTKLHNLDEVLFLYRMHNTNASKEQSAKILDATQRIQAFMKLNNPELYELYLAKARHKKTLRLFFIPILSIITQGNKTKIKLFDLLTISTIKSSIKMLKD